jgi:hypothetical protein
MLALALLASGAQAKRKHKDVAVHGAAKTVTIGAKIAEGTVKVAYVILRFVI